jgi:hypothetical protein
MRSAIKSPKSVATKSVTGPPVRGREKNDGTRQLTAQVHGPTSSTVVLTYQGLFGTSETARFSGPAMLNAAHWTCATSPPERWW